LPTLPDGSIRVEQVWKRFRADKNIPLFYDQLIQLRKSMTKRGGAEYRWVLKDVNFTVEPGESVALVGINGSGKTTLLKVLSQVTYPTAGICTVRGRIGALLSVSAGLHPDLTGRENVFLYGAVLGMGRQRLRQQFDEIVEFAGLADAIDRQVKFFSSGMTMRLGFSIAAHLEPDVLLVDEALAVGDANFQQKCLQRIGEIVRSGTTLMYVSHDLASVEATCKRSIWLSDAVVRAAGPTKDVVAMYRDAMEKSAEIISTKEGAVRVLNTDIKSTDGSQLRTAQPVEIAVTFNSPVTANAEFFFGISQGPAFPMFFFEYQGTMPEGEFEARVTLEYLPLPKGHYSVWAAITGLPKKTRDPWLPWQPIMSFDAFGPDRRQPPEGVMVLSPIHVGAKWEIN
jgi:ABC-type polysaccharide/polyol phosphate transport system ATPase subunit